MQKVCLTRRHSGSKRAIRPRALSRRQSIPRPKHLLIQSRFAGGGLQSDMLSHLAWQCEDTRALFEPEHAVEVAGVGIRL